MQRFRIWTIVVVLAFAAGFAFRSLPVFDCPVTLTSLSPNDAHRVVLVERTVGIDRQFVLWLDEIESGKRRIVFRSPDEGRPGSERIVWSVDGSRFLLLGRHFAISDSGKLGNGEQAYLMFDVRSDQMWCNSSQGSFTGFGLAELQAIVWLGWMP